MNILSIPLYYESPEKFSAKLKMSFSRVIKDWDPRFSESDAARDRTLNMFKDYFSSRFPDIHKYNNILGYAELVFDFNDVLIYYYLNGDKRKIYNRKVKNRNNKNAIFYPLCHYYGGTFKEFENKEIRKALECSFIAIEKQCKEWNVYVDFFKVREMINYLDFKLYLEKNDNETNNKNAR